MMYQVGAWIVYGGARRVPGGRCGTPRERAAVLPAGTAVSNLQNFTPVDNPKVIMRPLVSRREAEALIDRIPDLQPEAYYNKVLRELTEHYDTILKTYDCEALLKLTMSIYAKKQEAQGHKRRLGAVDESFLRRAEELLFSELAAALGLERDQVQPYIAARVEAGSGKSGRAVPGDRDFG